jgi:predicted outer membrane repeat protein
MSSKSISLVSLRLVLIAFTLFTFAHVVRAANQVVSDCGDNGGTNQLRRKINDAQNGDGGGTITFTCGPSITLLQGVLPTITTNITIDGGNAITISGNNASRVFLINPGATLTLNNIMITRGFVDDDGGAIYNSGGTLNINASKFTQNETTTPKSGGAIFTTGALNITNSEFANNKAGNGGALMLYHPNSVTNISGSNFHDNQTTNATDGWGGAILVFDGASATVGSTTFNLNQARWGGAIYVYLSASLTLNNNCTLSNNNAIFAAGGGIYSLAGTVYVTDSTLNGNAASFGGGVANYGGTAALANVTFSTNSAVRYGGGFYNFGTATLTNITFSSNSASDGGGGFYHGPPETATLTNVTFSGNSTGNLGTGGGLYREGGTVNLRNVLFAKGSSGVNCAGQVGGIFSLSDDNSCGFPSGRNGVNLNLGALANNGGFTQTHLPGAGSAAIDNGTGVNCPPTDQRGISRPQGLACDVGSVEVIASTPTPTPTVIFVEAGTVNRAVALDSVTHMKGPFPILTDHNFSTDRHTRVIIFTSNLGVTQPDPSILTVQAAGIALTVEYVATFTGVPGLDASFVIVRLPDGLPAGDLPLTVTLHGVNSSNAPTISISP